MALGSSTLVTLADALKQLYPTEVVAEALAQDIKLWGLIKQEDIFEGAAINHTVQHGNPQGVAVDLTNAISNKSTPLYKRFNVPRAQVYGTGTIDGIAIRASRSNKGAVVRELEKSQSGLMTSLKRMLSSFLWGNGGGAIGQVASISTTDITLTNRSDSIWFEPDQVLQLSATDGTSGAVRAGTVQVAKVNRKTGVITMTGNVTAGIAAAVANDFIFIRGSHFTANGGLTMLGVRSWVPTSDPSATAFLGVDRTIDPARLAGLRFDDAGGSIEEKLQNAMAYAFTEGADIDAYILNPYNYQTLVTGLGSKVSYVDKHSEIPGVGYRGVKLFSPNGEIDVFSDRGCPLGFAFGAKLDSWRLYTVGPFPGYLDDDGLTMLRESAADQYTWRMGGFGNLVCLEPGQNIWVNLTT